MSKNFDGKRTRKGAVVLGFRGFLTLNFQNSFLGVFGAKMGKKALFGPNFCKSLSEKKWNKYTKIRINTQMGVATIWLYMAEFFDIQDT